MPRVLSAVLVAAVVAAVPAVAAGKPAPNNGSSWSITLNETDPHLGGTVTFTAAYPRSVKSPRVAVRCYQNGAMTYAEAGPADQPLVLGGGGSEWKTAGGDADCTAELFWIDWSGQQQQFNTLAWYSFHAAG